MSDFEIDGSAEQASSAGGGDSPVQRADAPPSPPGSSTPLGLPGLAPAADPLAAVQAFGHLGERGQADLDAARAGVAGASSGLPHADIIQRSFGKHDVGGITAAVGGKAAKSCNAMGALGYTSGTKIAFASEPDVRLAAHEATHVIQQEGGVQLATGVGVSGDAYEQHADAVAELVVRGESAESLLDEHAGDPTSSPAAGDFVQRFDSPHHIRLGDSVDGEAVTVKGVTFSAGELAAVVDYVGDATALYDYEYEDLVKMKSLLTAGSEDVLLWDKVTAGNYSTESQDNEKHFAPGSDGVGFRGSFISKFTEAIATPVGEQARDMDKARMLGYTAEHYLQDSFSAGHQVAAIDVNDAVMKVLDLVDLAAMLPHIASGTWDKCSGVISEYAIVRPPPNMVLPAPLGLFLGGSPWTPIDSKVKFMAIASIGGFLKGRASIVDAIRQFVHERLGEVGVEVSSAAHPTPWTLLGDHDIEESPESIEPMQRAMAECRQVVETGVPAANAEAEATAVFETHAPMPTDKGTATVADQLIAATDGVESIQNAVLASSIHTIRGIMDFLSLQWYVKKLSETTSEPAEFPDIPDFEPEDDRESYIPERGDEGESSVPDFNDADDRESYIPEFSSDV